ncbi:hypothetical protein [Streptomyces bullii]|uniref:Uncharacterized protein n=1 Tax=Streptomyces bullii TaxID=349910 RepID=A0ABW0V327_9ACTN
MEFALGLGAGDDMICIDEDFNPHGKFATGLRNSSSTYVPPPPCRRAAAELLCLVVNLIVRAGGHGMWGSGVVG